MKKLFIGISVITIVIGSFLYWHTSSRISEHYIEAQVQPSPNAIKSLYESDAEAMELTPLDGQGVESLIDQYERYMSELHAGDSIREQLLEIEQLSDKEKQQQAESVIAKIDEQLSENQISNTEALFLQLALMKYLLPREEYISYSKKLMAQHKQRIKDKWTHYEANRDPSFIEYKQREKALVADILTMDSFPNGMTRDEYLALKLSELKKEVYTVTP